MSGHANFNTISGYTALHLQPNPQVEDDIHVAGNQPVGDANGGEIGVGPQDGPQNAQVDAQAESTNALVRQLDILLARAAASATQSVDATAVKAALGELDLPEDKRKALAAAADEKLLLTMDRLDMSDGAIRHRYIPDFLLSES